jgi:hypothetical protein
MNVSLLGVSTWDSQIAAALRWFNKIMYLFGMKSQSPDLSKSLKIRKFVGSKAISREGGEGFASRNK